MLIEFAKQELSIAGLLDKDSDYDGMVGEAVLKLVEVFAEQGHSGFSAAMTLDVFNKVASYQNLTPITSKPEEWFQYDDSVEMWQSKRNPSVFSKDGGRTWYDLEGKENSP